MDRTDTERRFAMSSNKQRREEIKAEREQKRQHLAGENKSLPSRRNGKSSIDSKWKV
jgi:hypothetical protein